jgi:hypothetical protein
MGTPESAVETRPKSVIGEIALIAIGSLMVPLGSMAHSAGLEVIGGAFIVLGIAGLARTKRFRWWQLGLVVLATMVCSALLLALAVVGLILFAFRHYP